METSGCSARSVVHQLPGPFAASRTCRIPSLHTSGTRPSPATETRSDSRSIARAETHEHADRDEQRESWADDRTERSGVREECF
jgi:hypothetical protein